MGNHRSNSSKMTNKEVRDKFIQGGKLAIEKLIERKKKDNSFLVVSQDGKVTKINANEIKK
jgi:uncharacterized surface anchored protein